MLYHKLIKNYRKNADRIAIIDNDTCVTYSLLINTVSAIKEYLDSTLTQHKYIGILLPNGLMNIQCLLAIPLAKKIVIPIDANTNKKNLHDLLKAYPFDAIFTVSKYKTYLEDINTPYFLCEELDSFSLTKHNPSLRKIESLVKQLDEQDVASIFFTSGTTGIPKGVLLTHANSHAAVEHIVSEMNLKSDIIESLPMPLSHSFGFARLRAVLSVGGTVVVEPGLLFANRVFAHIKKYKVNALSMVPAGYEMMLTVYKEAFQNIAPQLLYIELGSAPMSVNMKKSLSRACPNAVICMHYGSTEASRSLFIHFKKDSEHLSSLGKPPEGVITTILEDNELLICANTVSPGYWNTSPKKKHLSQHKMGDLVSRDKDGYFYLKGRKNSLINIGGYKVGHLEIEDIICQNDSVKQVAVIGKGSRLVAFLIIEKGHTLNQSELKALCLTHLESYKVPQDFIILERFPMTRSGTIERHTLQEMADD